MSDQEPVPFRLYNRGKRFGRPGASRTDVRAVWFAAALIVLIGLCGIMYVGQTSRVYVLRRQLQDWKAERVGLYRSNALLRSTIAQVGVMGNLDRWAVELGYVDAGQPHYVTFTYVPVSAQSGLGASSEREVEQLSMGEEPEEGIAARISRWGQDALSQFREWIDLANVRSGGQRAPRVPSTSP